MFKALGAGLVVMAIVGGAQTLLALLLLLGLGQGILRLIVRGPVPG